MFPCETDSKRHIPNNAHDCTVNDSKIAPLRLYDLRHTWQRARRFKAAQQIAAFEKQQTTITQ